MTNETNNLSRHDRALVEERSSMQRMVGPLTAMQARLIESLNGKYASNGSMSTTELAWRNKTSRLAVWAAMRSLEAQGRAGYFRRGEDRWAVSMWFLSDELKRPKVGDERREGESRERSH